MKHRCIKSTLPAIAARWTPSDVVPPWMSSTSDFSKSPNLHLMIPFVRTRRELEECLALVDSSPLGRQRGLHRWVMAEVPSVVHWLLGPHGRHRFSHTESSVLVARA